jgi:hypothetical protein
VNRRGQPTNVIAPAGEPKAQKSMRVRLTEHLLSESRALGHRRQRREVIWIRSEGDTVPLVHIMIS